MEIPQEINGKLITVLSCLQIRIKITKGTRELVNVLKTRIVPDAIAEAEQLEVAEEKG